MKLKDVLEICDACAIHCKTMVGKALAVSIDCNLGDSSQAEELMIQFGEYGVTRFDVRNGVLCVDLEEN